MSSVQALGAGCPCSRVLWPWWADPLWVSLADTAVHWASANCGRSFFLSWTRLTLYVLLWVVHTRKAVLELLMSPAWLPCSEIVPHKGSSHISVSSRLSKAPVTSQGAAGGPRREDLHHLHWCVMLLFVWPLSCSWKTRADTKFNLQNQVWARFCNYSP